MKHEQSPEAFLSEKNEGNLVTKFTPFLKGNPDGHQHLTIFNS